MSAPRTLASRWVYAAKPASWPKLLVPFALGQAIGATECSWRALAAVGFGLAFTVLDLLFIVFLNDWGDRDVDLIKRRLHPDGCSKKTIPDKILPAHHLLIAGLLAGAGALLVAGIAGAVLDRPFLLPLALLALFLFAAYTLPPLKLNYRGGGELLEMIGVGCVLPSLHAYLQEGALSSAALFILPGFSVLCLASAIASGLSDERSDRRGGKRTFVTTFGNRLARRAVEGLTFSGALVWVGTGLLTDLPAWCAILPAAVVLFHGARLISLSGAALTDAFAPLGRYKLALHHAIWRGAMCAAMLFAWWHLSLAI